MASKLILDRSDPGIDELVSRWKNGGQYVCEIEITQTDSGPNVASFNVDSLAQVGSEPGEEGDGAPEEKPEPPKPKPADASIKVKY